MHNELWDKILYPFPNIPKEALRRYITRVSLLTKISSVDTFSFANTDICSLIFCMHHFRANATELHPDSSHSAYTITYFVVICFMLALSVASICSSTQFNKFVDPGCIVTGAKSHCFRHNNCLDCYQIIIYPCPTLLLLISVYTAGPRAIKKSKQMT